MEGIRSWRGVCLVWWGGHSKHLEICVAMSAGKKERKERGMIDENERKEREQKALCERLRKVWDITLGWSVSRC